MARLDWVNLSDEDLLKIRICDLSLKIEGTSIEPLIEEVLNELKDQGLPIQPKIYLGDEWFSPEGAVSVSVPFYLAHSRLIELEKKMILDAEGANPGDFKKLLRHECGHCFDHAYGFSKRAKWKALFGSPDLEYHPENYRPRPYSRSFVKHLDNWYAQAHPDEDFAETFAVWMTPGTDWKTVYSDWPVVLDKLWYIEALVKEARTKPPRNKSVDFSYAASKSKMTLETYYHRKRQERAEDYPDVFDGDLKSLFTPLDSRPSRELSAAAYLKKNRKSLIDCAARWTGERKYTLTTLFGKLVARCESLNLAVKNADDRLAIDVATYLSTLVNHHLFTGKFKRTV